MPIIKSLLDNDLYKFTQQQLVFHRFPDVSVEYEFKCRTEGIDLRPYGKQICEEISQLGELKLSDDEFIYLRRLPAFSPAYLSSLKRFRFQPDSVITYWKDNEFSIRITGNWYDTILFEVPILAIVNEIYFRNTTNPATCAYEGGKRLREKIKLLKSEGEGFVFSDFGTRRRYSAEWHRDIVLALLWNSDSFVGTSNVLLSMENSMDPIGTMAHEYLQAFQVLAPLHKFQQVALETWLQEYRGQLAIALTDVVGLNAFLRDFDLFLAKAYDGVRHDSGDPYKFVDAICEHYGKLGIDPKTKLIVFSDGLTIPTALDIRKYCGDRIKSAFGIGTNLTNDLGPTPLNIVIKMTKCNDLPVAKLSDSPGKTMCKDSKYIDYLQSIFRTYS